MWCAKLVGYVWVLVAAYAIVAGYAETWQQRDFETIDGVVVLLAFVPGIFLLKWAAYREKAARRRL